MNRRFKINVEKDILREDDVKKLVLYLRVPYKCFGKIKYTDVEVYYIFTDCIPNNIIRIRDIEDYVVMCFEKQRKDTLQYRIIQKMKK